MVRMDTDTGPQADEIRLETLEFSFTGRSRSITTGTQLRPELPALCSMPERRGWARAMASIALEAFDDFYGHYKPLLVALLRARGLSESVADELAHDALTQAWLKREQYDPTKNTVGWLMTIAMNRWIDRVRADAHLVSLEQRQEERGDAAQRGIGEEGTRTSPRDEEDALPTRSCQEAREDLVRITFNSKLPSNQLLAYSYSVLLGYKPQEFCQPLLPEQPRSVYDPRAVNGKFCDTAFGVMADRFLASYAEESQLPEPYLRSLALGFLNRVSKEEADRRGPMRFLDFYRGENHPAYISDWAYGVREWVFEETLAGRAPALQDLVLESPECARVLMQSALESHVKPLLTRAGFTGKFPNFFRPEGRRCAVFRYGFDERSLRFTVLAAVFDLGTPSRAHPADNAWRKKVCESPRWFHILRRGGDIVPMPQALQERDSFRYGAGTTLANGRPVASDFYDAIAGQVSRHLETVDAWLRRAPAVPLSQVVG